LLEHLSDIYSGRFTAGEMERKKKIWNILAVSFFQKYVPVFGSVVDLGAGNGEFVNAIQAERRIAVDLNPQTKDFLAPGVEFIEASSNDLAILEDHSIDTIFTSNFFEHLPSPESLIDTLKECRRYLKSNGTLVIVIPNIKFVKEDFWDYLDHSLPLSHRSMLEALSLAGFKAIEVFPQFLPYTIKHQRVHPPLSLLPFYLRNRWLWRIFGKQMLIVASPQVID
jgi:SAM-dependent methyltransferase